MDDPAFHSPVRTPATVAKGAEEEEEEDEAEAPLEVEVLEKQPSTPPDEEEEEEYQRLKGVMEGMIGVGAGDLLSPMVASPLTKSRQQEGKAVDAAGGVTTA